MSAAKAPPRAHARQLFILTGASRGMGLAMAEQLLAPQHLLLCISRHRNAALASKAEAAGAPCEQWALDLAQPTGASARLQGWIAALDATAFDSASLINNAAALTRIGAIDDCTDTELSSAMRVVLEAPLLLCAAFLRATRGWSAKRRVLNVLSGLARRAMAGQAPYCAAKAGIEHLSRALALDEALRPNGAKVVAIAPGIVDTDMQTHLRAADDAGFPEKAIFVGWKDSGQLASPADAAARVLGWLDRSDFGADPVVDVRDT